MAKLDLTKLGGSKPAPATAATPAPAPSTGLAFLKQRQQQAEPAAVAPAAPKAGGLGFLMGQAKTGGTIPAAAPIPPNPPEPKPEEPKLDVSDDLAALLDSDTGGGAKAPATLPSGRVSRFADEEPAIAPERDLPADAEKPMRQFVESLDSVYKIVHEPDLLGGVIKNIMMELATKPEYRKLITPKDMHTMIRGMRDSMGMARIKKEESKAKRSGGAKSRKTTKVDDLDVLAALDELGDFG